MKKIDKDTQKKKSCLYFTVKAVNHYIYTCLNRMIPQNLLLFIPISM